MLKKCEELAKAWHEAGRARFEREYNDINYDTQYNKKVIEKRKYINLDERNSGVFMVDKTTGMIYLIKAYGVPNKKKRIGHITEVTGRELSRHNWY